MDKIFSYYPLKDLFISNSFYSDIDYLQFTTFLGVKSGLKDLICVNCLKFCNLDVEIIKLSCRDHAHSGGKILCDLVVIVCTVDHCAKCIVD